jgi:hypothetical protein
MARPFVGRPLGSGVGRAIFFRRKMAEKLQKKTAPVASF